MKRHVLPAALIGALLGCSSRRDNTPPGETFDAGSIFTKDTPTVVHKFVVKNTTGLPVRVLEYTRSCSCTTVDYQRRMLAPGESMPLTLTIRTFPTYAEQDASCVLKTDHPTLGEWRYSVHFRNYPEAVATPVQLDFGRLELASRSTAASAPKPQVQAWVSTFAASNGRPPAIASIASPAGLAVTWDRTPTREVLDDNVARANYRLTAELDPPAGDVGPRTAQIVVLLEGGSKVWLDARWIPSR